MKYLMVARVIADVALPGAWWNNWSLHLFERETLQVRTSCIHHLTDD